MVRTLDSPLAENFSYTVPSTTVTRLYIRFSDFVHLRTKHLYPLTTSPCSLPQAQTPGNHHSIPHSYDFSCLHSLALQHYTPICGLKNHVISCLWASAQVVPSASNTPLGCQPGNLLPLKPAQASPRYMWAFLPPKGMNWMYPLTPGQGVASLLVWLLPLGQAMSYLFPSTWHTVGSQ